MTLRDRERILKTAKAAIQISERFLLNGVGYSPLSSFCSAAITSSVISFVSARNETILEELLNELLKSPFRIMGYFSDHYCLGSTEPNILPDRISGDSRSWRPGGAETKAA